MQYPNVHLRLRETYPIQLIDALRDGSIDIALLRDTGPANELLTEPLEEETFVAVVPRRHALARRKSIRMENLRGEPFVFFPKQAGAYAWENAVSLCRKAGFVPNIVQEAPHWAHHPHAGRRRPGRDPRTHVSGQSRGYSRRRTSQARAIRWKDKHRFGNASG